MNQWKSAHAVETKARTLAEAMKGADVFFGLSAKGAVTPDMVRRWRRKPIIFAMANPDPEITPGGGAQACAPTRSSPPAARTIPTRSTTCSASPTSSAARSTCAPRTINDEMKIAAAEALAELAREDVPDEVAAAYAGAPPALRPRLHHPRAVRSAADLGHSRRRSPRRRWISGVARKPIVDMDGLSPRAAPPGSTRPPSGSQLIFEQVRAQPEARASSPRARRKRDPRRASPSATRGYGTPVLVGREERIRETHARDRPRPAPRARDLTTPRLTQHNTQLHRLSLRAAAAPRLRCYRDCQRHGQPGPQRLRRLHGALRRCRCDGHRHHPQLLSRLDEVPRVIDPRAGPAPVRPLHPDGARPHRLHRRHHGARAADRGASSPTSPSRRRRWRGSSATSRASRFLSYSNFGNPRGRTRASASATR